MWRRIGAVVGKEFIQLRRDRRTLAMMVILPVLWLVAFGYAVNFDIETIRVTVVDQATNADSRELVDRIDDHEDFRVTEKTEARRAKGLLERGETDVVVRFPAGYTKFPRQDGDRMRVQVDGSRLFHAQSALRQLNGLLVDVQKDSLGQVREEIRSSLEKADAPSFSPERSPQWAALLKRMPPEEAARFQEGLEKQLQDAASEQMESRLKAVEEMFPDPDRLKPEVDVLYNPDLKSVQFMIPGLVGLVLIFITTLMTALGVVREKERGTLEQLVVSPLGSFELLLGKLLPYCLIAVFDFLLVFAVGVWFFDVPFRGELGSFLLVALLFLTGSLGMGLLISTVSQNQQQAMQLAILTLVPQFILSGFVFPLEAMPWGIRWLSYLMPLTYFIPISRGAFLKGTSPFDDGTAVAALAVYAVLFLAVATFRFRRSLG